MKEIKNNLFLWYSFTDKSFLVYDSNTRMEKFCYLDFVDMTKLVDLVLHPNFHVDDYPYALVVYEG